MKPVAVLSTILLAVSCSAAELTPNLLRLIPADARIVSGIDQDRRSNSALGRFFQPDHIGNPLAGPGETVVWIMTAAADPTNGPRELTAIMGVLPSHEHESVDAGDPADGFTKLDAHVRIASDPVTIREAQRRWTIDQPLNPIAEKARGLSQSFDTWFVISKPFSVFSALPPTGPAATPAPPLKYRQDLIDAVEEISGGIRYGTNDEFYLEAVFRDTDDAWAAATLARWLPGMMQLQTDPGGLAALVNAMEDLRISADGTRVTISFHLPEDKARSVLDMQKPRPVIE